MEDISIGQYRSHDSPKNFAIRVKFWKVTPDSIIPSARFSTTVIGRDAGEDGLALVEKREDNEECEEHVIKWQEKLFSEKEFSFYGDRLNCLSSLEKKYNEDVETIKRSFGERPNKRIFTRVDCDVFRTFDECHSMTLTENEQMTKLAEKMSKEKYGNTTKRSFNTVGGLRRRNIVVDEPTEAMKSNHVITTPSKQMQIVVDLSSEKDGIMQFEEERIICTVEINANGLVVVKPDLKKEKVYKLEVYHEIRSIYQYTLRDASIAITKLQKSQEANLYYELYNRHAQLKQFNVGRELSHLPRSNEIFVYSLCEIVSAKNFEYNYLYVQYMLELPSGWKSRENNLLGVTQSCRMNKEGIAHFCFPLDFQLTYEWLDDYPDDFIRWPVLYLQVYSLDSWERHRIEGYGYCQLPDVAGATCVEIDTWRPKDENAFSEMRRYFVGGTRELKDVSYVKKTEEDGNLKLSKFYFKSISTGSVLLRLNTIFQTKVEEESFNSVSKWKKLSRRAGGYAAAIGSLAQVMDAFHRARKRMLAARSTLPLIS